MNTQDDSLVVAVVTTDNWGSPKSFVYTGAIFHLKAGEHKLYTTSQRAQDGIELAALLIDKRWMDYDREYGTTDPETGVREYPSGGDDYVFDLQELAEDVRKLKQENDHE